MICPRLRRCGPFLDAGPGPVGSARGGAVAELADGVVTATSTAAGYRDNGAPGERAGYDEGYYAAFVLDPDGNNVEVVNHNR